MIDTVILSSLALAATLTRMTYLALAIIISIVALSEPTLPLSSS